MTNVADFKRETFLRFLAQPTDVNFGGKVHGGSVMKWLDQAGYVCATNWSNCYCVTAFVGDINFMRPIRVGDLVTVSAKIIHTGRSSMHIAVEVHSSPPASVDEDYSVRCIMVFVAVDEAGKSVQVPEWVPQTEQDRRLHEYALRIQELRGINRQRLEELHVSNA